MENLYAIDSHVTSEWLLVHIAARRIECSPRSVRRYIQQGTLGAQRKGRRSWLVRNSDVIRLIRRRGF